VIAGFTAVDEDHDAASLVDALDTQANFPAIQRLRAAAADLLELRPGQRVVDAGCGVGQMTERFAAAVGGDGRVIGVDASETMLAEARRRMANSSLPIEFRCGTVTDLDLGTASVDAAYCERVFQHLAYPESALRELVRVARPGGRVLVIDTDWGMHAIAGPDPTLTAAVVACWAETNVNGWSGRRLPGLFADAGLDDISVTADSITATRMPTTSPFQMMASLAVAEGALALDDARRWLAQLAQADADGRFFWAVTLFAVAATKAR